MATNYLSDANIQGAWLFRQGSGLIVHDDTGKGNIGVFKSGTEPGWDATDVSFATTGAAPNSVLFDGSDDFIACGASDTLLAQSTALTIVAWINPTIDGTVRRILDRSTVLFCYNDTNVLRFQSTGTTTLDRISGNNFLTEGSWQHVAVTWDGSTTASNVKLYCNGVEEDSYGTTTNGATPTANAGTITYIGNRSDAARCFSGNITEVAVFDRVLSQVEIAEIYNYGITGGAVPTTTGQMLPTSQTGSAVSSWGGEAWVASAAILSMGSAATAGAAVITAASFDSGVRSHFLKATNFGLTVPDGYTIAGVIARMEAWATASCYVEGIKLLDTSRVDAGDNIVSGVGAPLITATTQILSFGGSANLWGNALTSDWVKHANFGVGFGIFAKAANVDLFVDYVTLEVCLTAPVVVSNLSLKYFFVEC